jgi:effector-binding domain-containing protein
MIDNCEIKTMEEQPVLSVRTHVPVEGLPQAIGKAYGSIFPYLGEMGETEADMPFVCYYNLDMQNLDVEIGVPVKQKLMGRGEVQASSIPAGNVASCMYTGAYEKMEPAYDEFNAWIKAQGYEPTGICYEFYYNSPSEVPVEQLKTRIMFPVKKL